MPTEKVCAVYMMSNRRDGVIYTGVTSNLKRRVLEHKNKLHPHSFTARYNLTNLVYYETTSEIRSAIAREKQIKSGNRARKIELIQKMNPDWKDLSEEL